MADQHPPISDTPEAFLAALGAKLTAQPEVDIDLASVLTAHLVRSDIAQSAVPAAKDAILKLAAERARLQGSAT